MSLPGIQTNIAALVKKAYSTDSSAPTANAAATSEASKNTKKEVAVDSNVSASAEVTLGESGNTTEIYTAQGLLQQMRQIQLSNTALLYGTGEDDEDNSGLFGMTGPESAGLEDMGEDWAEAISQHPDKAAVMIEKAKNTSINTMLNGKN